MERIRRSEVFVRDKVLGRVLALQGNPFGEFRQGDWSALFNVIGPDRLEWQQRHGFSARAPSQDFHEFPIPSVGGVPVFAYLVLITLFSIAIGPVNYIYLWKHKRLYLLVVTIPIIAIATSLALFGYSAIAHGFHTRSRVRSVTFLDQRTNTAVSTSRVSLYSGLAPGRGLQFSRDSAVYPIWPSDRTFESGAVDWTDQQTMSGGWFRSRTRTQFFVSTHRSERGRLEITPEPGGLSVANGLAWDLEALIVADDDGTLFAGEGIAAGDAARLSPLSEAQAAAWRKLIDAHPLQATGRVPPGSPTYYAFPGGIHPADASLRAPYSQSLSELTIRDLLRISPTAAESLPTRTYAAVLAKNPGIDTGIPGASEEASLHLLHGRY